MPTARQRRLVQARHVEPTKENVDALIDEIWRLQAEIATARRAAAIDMRRAAVAKYEEFCEGDTFTDEAVVKALSSLPLP